MFSKVGDFVRWQSSAIMAFHISLSVMTFDSTYLRMLFLTEFVCSVHCPMYWSPYALH